MNHMRLFNVQNTNLLVGICLLLFGCNIEHSKVIYQNNDSEVLMKVAQLQDANSIYAWYDVKSIGVEGKGWVDTEDYYQRIPRKAKGFVRDEIWNLGKRSAGLYVRFTTDSNTIVANWKLTETELEMFNMLSIGVSGLDLYVNDNGKWHEAGVVLHPLKFPVNEQVLVSGQPSGVMCQYTLYLPLYNGVESLKIGIMSGAKLAKASAWGTDKKPIVFYGSSIVQGGCASRPGMAHTNILQRRLNMPVINLGFSGNAWIEPEVAELLSELDPSVYVLDPVPNCDPKMLNDRFEKFISRIRDAHPSTPIVICESIVPYARDKSVMENNAIVRSIYNRLKEKGIKRLYYIKCADFIGTDGEAFVDMCHPTDLGFMRMADMLEPVLKQALH